MKSTRRTAEDFLIDQAREYLIELRNYLVDPTHFDIQRFCQRKMIAEPISSSDAGKFNDKLKHVAMELLDTERFYVDELRTIIENYLLKLTEPEFVRSLPMTIVQNKSILFSNLPEIYRFHLNSFLPDLEQVIERNFSIHSLSNCFLRQKSNFQLYEHYALNKSQSEDVWKEFCVGHEFFSIFIGGDGLKNRNSSIPISIVFVDISSAKKRLQKIQMALGHRLSLDAYLLKPIQRLSQYQLLLKEMIKSVSNDHDRFDLQRALDLILTILSDINDRMHSSHIVGYPQHLNSLGRLKLRAENCSIHKTKHRGTVYHRNKTSQRDLFLFQRKLLFCKRKEENSKNFLQYQFKQFIEIDQILVCTSANKNRDQLEILLKDSSFLIQFSTKNAPNETVKRWMETIRILIREQLEERRVYVKQRSSSLDHSQNTRRRKEISQATDDEIRNQLIHKRQIHQTPWL